MGRSGRNNFEVMAGVDNEVEMKYIESGGVLPYIFDRFA